MKTLLSLAVLAALSSVALADIQDPPMNDQGPTRKLGRGIANVAFGCSELFEAPMQINQREGNSAAFSYGLVKGVGRTVFRLGAGLYDIFTFPFPTYKRSFRAPYKSNIPWIQGGYEEFPPELGFQSRYRYSRNNYGW